MIQFLFPVNSESHQAAKMTLSGKAFRPKQRVSQCKMRGKERCRSHLIPLECTRSSPNLRCRLPKSKHVPSQQPCFKIPPKCLEINEYLKCRNLHLTRKASSSTVLGAGGLMSTIQSCKQNMVNSKVQNLHPTTGIQNECIPSLH